MVAAPVHSTAIERRGGTEADARALLEAVYEGRMAGRTEDGRAVLWPLAREVW